MSTGQTAAVLRSGSTDTSPAGWADLTVDLFAMVRLRAASIRNRVCLAAVCRPWHAVASLLLPPPAVLRSGSTDTSSAGWADLPDDLFVMVCLRVASIRDRVCLAAVCRPWHAAASLLPLPPAVPLLLLSPDGRSEKKHLCSPDGGWVLHVPSKLRHKRFVGSHQGGWIAATDDRTLVIVNLFSGVEVLLSAKQRTIGSNNRNLHRNLRKIIFSEHPTSSNCILAGLRGDRRHIVLCIVGRSGSVWSEKALYEEERISDFAFCNGELYGLTCYNEMLIKFEIGTKKDGTPVITSTNQMAIKRREGLNNVEYSSYIIELNGKLSVAVRNQWVPNSEPFFRVFKLVHTKDDEVYQLKWKQMSLGDHALFLGPTWSKAVHVPMGECRGMERNHIYYSYYTRLNDYEVPSDMGYSVTTDDGDRMCCRVDRKFDNGMKMTGYYTIGSYNCAMWFYPPDFQGENPKSSLNWLCLTMTSLKALLLRVWIFFMVKTYDL